MNKYELMEKARQVISKLKKKDVTTKDYYKDCEGLFCFNGHVLSQVLGLNLACDSSNIIDATTRSYTGLPEDSKWTNPLWKINDIHSQYTQKKISFTKAKKQVLDVIDQEILF